MFRGMPRERQIEEIILGTNVFAHAPGTKNWACPAQLGHFASGRLQGMVKLVLWPPGWLGWLSCLGGWAGWARGLLVELVGWLGVCFECEFKETLFGVHAERCKYLFLLALHTCVLPKQAMLYSSGALWIR